MLTLLSRSQKSPPVAWTFTSWPSVRRPTGGVNCLRAKYKVRGSTTSKGSRSDVIIGRASTGAIGPGLTSCAPKSQVVVERTMGGGRVSSNYG